MSGATRGAAVLDGRGRLRAAGVAEADLDARVLAEAAFGLSAADFLARPDAPASAREIGRYDAFIERRIAGEPVARILGRREFWGLDFALGPDTLVPRPDTETLVEAVLAHVPNRAASLNILDLGTGTGCLLVALLSEYPNARGAGVDLSQGAVAVAAANAGRLGVGHRARFVRGSWTDGVSGRFDVVVSNPPYIPAGEIAELEPEVRVHDPALALDGGADGLDAYRALAKALPGVLAAGGVAVLELGIGQEHPVAALMAAHGLARAAPVHRDIAGRPRALAVRRSDPAAP